MSDKEIRDLFLSFCGKKVFRDFVKLLPRNCAHQGQLMFWQDKLWKEFTEKHNLSIPPDYETVRRFFKEDEPGPSRWGYDRKTKNAIKNAEKAIEALKEVIKKTNDQFDRDKCERAVKGLAHIRDAAQNAWLQSKEEYFVPPPNKKVSRDYTVLGELDNDTLDKIETAVRASESRGEKISEVLLVTPDRVIVRTFNTGMPLADNGSELVVLKTPKGWNAEILNHWIS